MQRMFFPLFLLNFLLFFSSVHTQEHSPLTFNIISHSLQNGAGKEIDVAILRGELERLGHHVNLFDYYQVDSITSADVNIFLAQFKTEWFSKARLNWFVPNAECCDGNIKELQEFDLILCKTDESLRIFKQISNRVYYLGFTSIDRYNPSIAKDFSKHLHVAGKSRMKGTEEILNAWRDYPGLPHLTLIKHKNTQKVKHPTRNVELITKRISSSALLNLQNQCGIHLCPSKTEGFGHYIMEAMSVGAVVITTNGPPMNDFITDARCLVKCSRTGRKKYATTYIISSQSLAHTVKALQQLSNEELREIGQRNREEYLRRAAEFKQNFELLIHQTAKDFS